MRYSIKIVLALAAAFLLLSIPGFPPSPGEPPAGTTSFVWDQDSLWLALESEYVAARSRGCSVMSDSIDDSIAQLSRRAQARLAGAVRPDDPALDSLEYAFFDVAPLVAACPNHTANLTEAYRLIREGVRQQARAWDMSDAHARQRLYRTLYGGRAALEEVMLQHPDEVITLIQGRDEPSATPSIEMEGLRVHSGDILASRGGYPTSALISRGSDYPGNFSHIALVHVDEETGAGSVIEAHIEVGVAVATPEQYLRDKKLRIMVLRPRADLPALRDDPMLPHRAATAALERARSERIPYDFEMNYRDPSELFCSEVASAAYRDVGLDLWMGISTISSEGLRRWLSSFGVRHFETQEPSDLEYDPQLAVVAEWRDAETLFKDHIDNAVIDVMLEGAERGDDLVFPWYRLAPARLAKAYSFALNLAGRAGPIPEGMSAAAALRNQVFSQRHNGIATDVVERAEAFERELGYPPPYWKLIELAREAVASNR